jgi:hypothetical protein
MLGIGGALLIKILPIGVIPLCLLAAFLESAGSAWQRLTRLLISAAVLVGVVVLAYAPFWVGPETIHRVRQSDGDYLASIPALIVAYFPDGVDWLVFPRVVLAAAIALWLIYSLIAGRLTLETAAFEALFATILLSTHFSGWYLALLVATSVLTLDRWRERRAIVFTLTAMLTTPIWSYGWLWLQAWDITPQFLSFVVPFTFVPPLLLAFPPGIRAVDSLIERTKEFWQPRSEASLAVAAPSIPQPFSPTRGERGVS